MSLHSRSVTPMVEGGILSAIAIIFAFISAYLPVLGAFINFIWPVPIILLGIRHGYRYSIMATVASGILIALLIGPMQAVNVVIGFGLIGIALGHSFRNNHSPLKTILIGSVATFVSMVMVVAVTAAVMGVNLFNMQFEALSNAIKPTLDYYRSAGYSEEELNQATQLLTVLIDRIRILFPALLVSSALFGTFFNYWLAKKILKKLGYVYPDFAPASQWCLPRWTVLPYILGTAAMFWGQSNSLDLVYNIGMNVQIAGILLLLLQGVAVLFYFAGKYKVSKFVRGLILVLILTNGLFLQIATIVGAFDIIVDYRRLRVPQLK